MTFKDDESDIQSTLSDAPPDWNSDDEPPEDHVGDENTCSRDGAVRKVIQKVGKGLERPGQNDIVTLRFSTIQLDGSDNPPGSGSTESPEDDVVTVEMGDNHLPLAVEFAVKHMRVGEVAEVRAPAVYSAVTSPLCGRSLRTQPGVLPKTDKVKRRHRFLPAAPRAISEQAEWKHTVIYCITTSSKKLLVASCYYSSNGLQPNSDRLHLVASCVIVSVLILFWAFLHPLALLLGVL